MMITETILSGIINSIRSSLPKQICDTVERIGSDIQDDGRTIFIQFYVTSIDKTGVDIILEESKSVINSILGRELPPILWVVGVKRDSVVLGSAFPDDLSAWQN